MVGYIEAKPKCTTVGVSTANGAQNIYPLRSKRLE